jgi:hypothetical protein
MSFDKQRRVQSGQALVGALVVWTLSLPAAIPAYFATFVTLYFATLPVTAVTTDQAWLNIVCLAIFGTLLVIAPLLTVRYADTWIPKMFNSRPPTESERPIMRLVETLAPAAGLQELDVRIVDSEAINSALLGRSDKGWTLMLTSGATSLKYDEQESLVALALAGASSGNVAAGRALLAASGPAVVLSRLGAALATPKRAIALVCLTSAASLAGGFVLDQSVTGAIAFASIFQIGALSFAIPAVALWIVLLTAIQAFAATLVVRPSRAAADAGALALTRYPPPLRRLLVRARTAKTRPALLPLGLGAIWSLPVGTENSKSENLLWRIRRLDSLDPDGTIRSLGG